MRTTSRKTSCPWSIARPTIPGFALCRWGSTSRSHIIKPPLDVDWERYLPQIAELGLKLSGTARVK